MLVVKQKGSFSEKFSQRTRALWARANALAIQGKTQKAWEAKKTSKSASLADKRKYEDEKLDIGNGTK